ncbi:unnamed protein product [Penicillium roqueforti FM164]|uniref:Genomic scaffold, ProqFM164S01 n=1 Tax=Penicillium roqueforti (strain FM164) TaxID=1365484 RepID=W6PYB0_PENRF|nr:unnamed protein product [Penicillium roqueforti FM164]
MLGIEDPSILADFEEAEKSNPSPREIIEDRVIYLSHKLKKTNQHDRPVLCDFSQAPLDQPVTQKQDSDANHIAEMIALLGPPPREMIQNSDYATDFFDIEVGRAPFQFPLRTLEHLEGNLEGEQQQLFLKFMRKMLRWRLEERCSARDLLSDQWLRSL